MIILSVLATLTHAHPGFPASAIVHVDAGGRITIHVRHDALAFALNETPVAVADEPMRQLLAGPREQLAASLAEAKQRFITLCELAADGQRVPIEITASPSVAQIEEAESRSDPVRLPIMLDFVATAQVPAGTRRFALQFPEVLGDVIMTIERPGAEPFSMPLRAAERTPDITVNLSRRESDGEPADQSEIQNPKSKIEVAWRYLVLGVTHIIPHGLDHMLFVLGLFFLSPKLKPLLWQVTAFTLAHSVTLTLAVLDIVRLSPDVVEPIIAASIAFVAIENLLTTRIHPWRPAVVFAFGLMHGMGFAGVLMEVGLPRGQLVPAVVSFNVGVEVGQLIVIALALMAVGWWRNRKWYRPAIAMPASALIALTGLWWTVQRVFEL